MYNDGPRMGSVECKATPVGVGPSTYFIFDGPTYQNKAPFLSKSIRNSILGRKPNTEAIYDGILPKDIVGGTSLNYTSERFVDEYDDSPGPADYDPISPKDSPRRSKPATTFVRKKGGYMFRGRAPLTASDDDPAVSVPSKHADANGYDIDQCGHLRKIPPDTHDLSLGPAFYDAQDECFNSQKYRGCAWSRNKSQRSDITGGIRNPGPADYDVRGMFGDPHARMQDIIVREMKRKTADLPRFAEIIQRRTIRDHIPGPEYKVVYDDVSTKANRRSYCVGRRPFVTGSKRFRLEEDLDKPGPTRYSPVTDCMACRRKGCSVSNTPFSSSDNRFKGYESHTPSPDTYDVSKPPFSRKQKFYGFPTTDPPFFATAERVFYSSDDNPTPVDYWVKELKNPLAGHMNNAFMSRVERFPKDKIIEDPIYDDITAYRKLHDQKSHRKRVETTKELGSDDYLSTSVEDAKPSEGFLCGDKKFRPIYDFAGTQIARENPGPALYNVPVKRNEQSYFLPLIPRFRFEKSRAPGPGHYTLPITISGSMARTYTTQNVRIITSIDHRLKRVTKTTPFIKQVMLKKKLRWFATKPIKDYRHCC